MSIFDPVRTDDQTLNRIQANISKAFNQSASGKFTGGSFLQGISLVAGQDNLVAHKLGRAPSLWVICDQDTNSVLWSPASASLNNQKSDSNHINLRCSAGCTVSLWVN